MDSLVERTQGKVAAGGAGGPYSRADKPGGTNGE